MAFFAVGPGVCVWLALSELMPTRIRSNGMSIALLINQAVSTTIAAVFLPTVGKYGYGTMFFAFAGATVSTSSPPRSSCRRPRARRWRRSKSISAAIGSPNENVRQPEANMPPCYAAVSRRQVCLRLFRSTRFACPIARYFPAGFFVDPLWWPRKWGQLDGTLATAPYHGAEGKLGQSPSYWKGTVPFSSNENLGQSPSY